MKKILLLACSMFMSFSVHAQDFETAKDAVKNMGVGWNLGNTLESCSGSAQGLESETYWGQPVTKPELMKMMKEAGFGAIRVPVTWYNHMDANGKVDAAWMKRVHEVVDYVIDQNMYCILNVHHDTGAGTQWLHASMKTYNNVKEKYEYLWKQIADEFKDYGEKLVFESYNEMLDDYNSWNFASYNTASKYNAKDAQDAYDAINSYAKSFVTTVRGTAGNNAQRNLVINTYCAANGAGTWNSHLKEPLTSLVIPEGETNHVMVEVHAYPSIVYTNSNGDITSNKPIATIKAETKEMMDGLNTYLVSKDIPVIIGEWGTSNVDKAETDYMARKDLMLEFADDFVAQAKDYNIATFFWMGLSDGESRSMPAFNQADLAQCIVKAYHGSNDGYKYPTINDFETVYTINYTSDWAEAFLYGDWNRATVKVADYKSVRVEMEDDSYAGKLQIKIYGDKKSGSDYKEQLVALASGSSTTVATLSASTLGSTFWGITLQTLAGKISAKVKSATLIKADGTELPLTVSTAWGCDVTSESTLKTGISAVPYHQVSGDDAIYTLSGQKVTHPRKGIYIQNGKKLVIK